MTSAWPNISKDDGRAHRPPRSCARGARALSLGGRCACVSFARGLSGIIATAGEEEGDEREGDEKGDDESIMIDLDKIEPQTTYIGFVINSYSGESPNF